MKVHQGKRELFKDNQAMNVQLQAMRIQMQDLLEANIELHLENRRLKKELNAINCTNNLTNVV